MSTVQINPYRHVVGGGSAFALSYIGEASDTTPNNGSNTYSSVSIGATASDRIVILVVVKRKGSTTSSVTIGGVSCTEHAYVESTSLPFTVGIYSCSLASGTTADVSLTLAAGSDWLNYSIYRLVGASTTPTDAGTSTGTDSQSATITTVDGGCIVAGAGGNNTGPSANWTNVTEDYDVDPDVANNDCASGASDGSVSGTSVNVQENTVASTSAYAAMAAVSWEPS